MKGFFSYNGVQNSPSALASAGPTTSLRGGASGHLAADVGGHHALGVVPQQADLPLAENLLASRFA